MAGVVVAVSLAIFFAVPVGRWLGKKYEAVKEAFSVALRSGPERSSGKLQTPAKEERKDGAQKLEALWSVQVSSFRSEQHAVDLAAALKERGWDAYVIRAKVEAGDLYRTHVGRFRTREAAERLLQKLKDKESLANAFVAKM
jgi:cell division septation protein DedD